MAGTSERHAALGETGLRRMRHFCRWHHRPNGLARAAHTLGAGTLDVTRPGAVRENGQRSGRFLRQPEAATVRTNPITNRLANLFSFILYLSSGYLAQLGCDCELLPEIRETSLYCFVGTSSRERT